MEGTRNERVVVLVVSYLIGFVTAYIAFGLTQLEEKFVYVDLGTQSASVLQATQTEHESVAIPAITKEGFVLIQDNEARVISARQASSDEVLPDGYHVSIADYAISPDDAYVYFCEVPADNLDVCRPYIYDVSEDTVYPVRSDGERVAFDTEEGGVYWNQDGTLIIE